MGTFRYSNYHIIYSMKNVYAYVCVNDGALLLLCGRILLCIVNNQLMKITRITSIVYCEKLILSCI